MLMLDLGASLDADLGAVSEGGLVFLRNYYH